MAWVAVQKDRFSLLNTDYYKLLRVHHLLQCIFIKKKKKVYSVQKL